MKYFLYARKSTDTEDKQMASINDQISEMQRIAEREHLQIADIISEERSAKYPGRPKFNAMMQRIKKGEAQGVLCWKLNRLARNSIDGGQIIWQLQQGTIQSIHTYGREYRPSDNVIILMVEFGMAIQYSTDLSVDVKRGMRKKAERGWFPGTAPLGYMHVAKDARGKGLIEIIPHPELFQLVRKLWDLMLTGKYSIRAIKREADSLGLRDKKGKKYTKNMFYNLFTKEFYCGHFYWRNEHFDKERYKGNHQPMVTLKEFSEVQNILQKKRFVIQRKRYFPYRGLIRCGECQGWVTAMHKLQAICTNCKFKYSIVTKTICPKCKLDFSEMKNPSMVNKVYYLCTKNKGPCNQGSITQEIIENNITKELEKIKIGKDFNVWGLKALKGLSSSSDHEQTQIASRLKKRESELFNRLNGLIRMRADGEMSAEEIKPLKEEVLNELKALAVQIESATKYLSHLENAIKDSFDFALHSLKQFKIGDDSARNKIASKLALNLTLKDKNLYIATDNVYQCVKECEVQYMAKRTLFEPKKTIEKYSWNSDFLLTCPILCTKLTAIRTCLIDKILSTEKKSQ